MSLCALGILFLLFNSFSFTALWNMSQCLSMLILPADSSEDPKNKIISKIQRAGIMGVKFSKDELF